MNEKITASQYVILILVGTKNARVNNHYTITTLRRFQKTRKRLIVFKVL